VRPCALATDSLSLQTTTIAGAPTPACSGTVSEATSTSAKKYTSIAYYSQISFFGSKKSSRTITTIVHDFFFLGWLFTTMLHVKQKEFSSESLLFGIFRTDAESFKHECVCRFLYLFMSLL
jgi:hypothetical protein